MMGRVFAGVITQGYELLTNLLLLFIVWLHIVNVRDEANRLDVVFR